MHACIVHGIEKLTSKNFPLVCPHFSLGLRIQHIFELNTLFDHVLEGWSSYHCMRVVVSKFQVDFEHLTCLWALIMQNDL